MLSSQALDVVVGMAFIYLTLALLCAGINEWIAQLFRSRARHLAEWLRELMNGAAEPELQWLADLLSGPAAPKKQRKLPAAVQSTLNNPGAQAGLATLRQALAEPAVQAALHRNGWRQSAALWRHDIFGATPERPADSAQLQQFWQHPLIRALQKSGKKPSYIPPHTFTLALLDTLAPLDPQRGARTAAELREQVNILPDSDLRSTLLALIDDANGDIAEVRANIETWFGEAMERLAGWYKRRTRVVVLLLALAVSVGLNVDTFRVVGALYRDATVRAAVVAAAQRAGLPSQPSQDAPLTQIDQVQAELAKLNVPMGWAQPANRPALTNPWQLVMALFGWLVTALAVAQGAPFWFDLLNKLINLRATGQRPSLPEDSEPAEAVQLVVGARAPAARGRLRYARRADAAGRVVMQPGSPGD